MTKMMMMMEEPLVAVPGGKVVCLICNRMETTSGRSSNVPGTSESDSTQYARFQWFDGGVGHG